MPHHPWCQFMVPHHPTLLAHTAPSSSGMGPAGPWGSGPTGWWDQDGWLSHSLLFSYPKGAGVSSISKHRAIRTLGAEVREGSFGWVVQELLGAGPGANREKEGGELLVGD